jgi:diadenosine tetraphosphate (Ap4A) HIT family hydrolase
MTFILDPRLENDSVFICDLPLSQVRLSKNSAFPWLLLIPRQNDIVEIFDLSVADQGVLLNEMRVAAAVLKKLFTPKKLNVANLGNVVPQLHVHVIARFEEDKAWPGPVWNSGVKEYYADDELNEITAKIKKELTA